MFIDKYGNYAFKSDQLPLSTNPPPNTDNWHYHQLSTYPYKKENSEIDLNVKPSEDEG